MTAPCPDALHGRHGDPNTMGRCPYCGARLSGRHAGTATDGWDARRRERRRLEVEQDPTHLEPTDDDYYDGIDR